ncbi:MAG: GAF domain-containing protein [Pseudomonadota bacterium]
MTATLDMIRDCLEGTVPAILATVDEAGVPNVSLISQVHYVDPGRVALSHQFFNKTRRNILATRSASVEVVDPQTMAEYRLDLDYETTETKGPVFESMKAKLAGIASHTGMQGVFRLIGSDIFRVRTITPLRVARLPKPAAGVNLLAATRRLCADLSGARNMGDLFDRTMTALAHHFGIMNAMILLTDEAGTALYTVASLGYPSAGIGSEVALGDGVIGVAAREGVAVRIDHMTADYSYSATIRDRMRTGGLDSPALHEIPFPGLDNPESQIALPILWQGQCLGVLFAESLYPMRFWHDHEDALSIVAVGLGSMISTLRTEDVGDGDDSAPCPDSVAASVTLRHYAADDSIFCGHDYLIKGVAGAILWKLVREHAQSGRTEFSNRELRLDPCLRLPEHAENLEARLVLLERRLREKAVPMRIEKTGRGRFRLGLGAALVLEDA